MTRNRCVKVVAMVAHFSWESAEILEGVGRSFEAVERLGGELCMVSLAPSPLQFILP